MRIKRFACILLSVLLAWSFIISGHFVVCHNGEHSIKIEPYHQTHCCGDDHEHEGKASVAGSEELKAAHCMPCMDLPFTSDGQAVDSRVLTQKVRSQFAPIRIAEGSGQVIHPFKYSIKASGSISLSYHPTITIIRI